MQNEYRDPSRFGEFSTAGSNNIHPLALLALLGVLAIIFVGKRRTALIAGIGILCLIPSGQRVVIAGLDFAFLRILAIGLFARVVAYGELQRIRLSLLDGLVLFFGLWPLVAMILRGSNTSFVRNVGQGGDLILLYFAGRALVREPEDVRVMARVIFFVAIPVLCAFTVEKVTGRNFFAVFGGLSPITAIRVGKLRVQGAFAHPILAGTWWAAILPFFLVLIMSPLKSKDRLLGIIGGIICASLVIMTASSTPLAGLGVGLLGVLLFPIRKNMKLFWAPVLIFGAIIHVIHDLGVHHFALAKFPGLTGSTGSHRYKLIDACAQRMNEWFLFGGDSTYHWGWGLDDVTCEYVKASMAGGILQLLCLLGILFVVFRNAGRMIKRSGRDSGAVCYGMGIAVAVHMICFVAVTYFGQITLLFWVTLAALQSLSQYENDPLRRRPTVPTTARPSRRRGGSSLLAETRPV